MTRDDVLRGLLQLHENPRYLEVGVHSGVTFHAVEAAYKVAVDPAFRFPVPSPAITDTLEYHQVTSDEYFGQLSPTAGKFDVIYLDGLHTFEQTLRDLLNATACLAEKGVIVVDDVLPTSYAASLPDMEDFHFARDMIALEHGHDAWMGDVYKLVFFVECFMQSFSFAVVKENHGQLVLWPQRRPAVSDPAQTVETVARMDMITMLRRKPVMRQLPYAEIQNEYRDFLRTQRG